MLSIQESPRFGEYHTFPMSAAETPFVKLCEQLKPLIEEGRYSLIVGDDISGRLPTLAVREYANYVLQQAGKDTLPTVFLQNKSPYVVNVPTIEAQIEKRVLPFVSRDNDRRVLYVTEYVEEGRNVYKIQNAFQKYGVKFDIAALEINGWDNNTRTALDSLNDQADTLVIEGERVRRRSPLLHTYLPGIFVSRNNELVGKNRWGQDAWGWVARLRVYSQNYENSQTQAILLGKIAARVDAHTLVQKAIAQACPQK